MQNIIKKPVEELAPKNIGKTLATHVEKVENISNAMMQTGQEMVLCVEDILQQQFGFTDKDIVKFERSLKHNLSTLAMLERMGFSVLNHKDMKSVGEIAETRLMREKAARSGIALPSKLEVMKKLIK